MGICRWCEGLVLWVRRHAQVHRGERGEDVGLEERNQNLERRQEHQHTERQHADRNEEDALRLRLDQGLGEQREDDEQQVAGEHVGEESHGEREGSNDERRDELDRGDEDVQRLDRKSTRLNSSHTDISRMPSSA